MTNKLKLFIGNWKMFGDFGSFKIVNSINKFAIKNKKFNNKKIVICVPNTLIHFFKKKLKKKLFLLVHKIVMKMKNMVLLQDR